jgi:hypothetical protein
MAKPLEEYQITIDPLYAEGEEDLGIDMIAFVANPAVRVKGMAFSTAKSKQFFADEPKMRIIAPALIPMSIYRNDEMGEYYVKFTEKEIEDIHKKFMETLSNRDKFNLEHDEKLIAPAYVLEAWLVDDPEMDKSRLYNIDVPKGTLMMVAQVTDKQYYNDLIKTDRVGFSIEGFLGLKFHNQNKQKQSMKKTERKLFTALAFADGQLAPVGKITVITEDLKPESKALVIDETGKPVENYTGDILIGETLVKIENGVITDVVTGEQEVAMSTDEYKAKLEAEGTAKANSVAQEIAAKIANRKLEEDKKEEDKEEMGLEVGENAIAGANPEDKKEMEDITVEEEIAQAEVEDAVAEAEMAIDETELLNILAPKFDEIYKVIADLKIAVDEIRSHEAEDEYEEKEEEKTSYSISQKLSQALGFLNK